MARLFVGTAVLLALMSACGSGRDRTATSRTRTGATAARTHGGIQLTRHVPVRLKRACRDAQRDVRIRVVCPALIPNEGLVKLPGITGPAVFGKNLWLITVNTGDNGPAYIHWIAGAGRRSAVAHYLLSDADNVVKGLPRKLATHDIDGLTVTMYRYPAYPAGAENGGHIAAYVRCGSDLVFASVHGWSHGATATTMAIDLARRSHCARR